MRATKLVDGLSESWTSPHWFIEDHAVTWKHFRVYDSSALSHHFQPHDRTSRMHNYQLIWNKPKDGLRGLQANSFYYRTVNTWHHLPKDVVSAKDIDSFKTRLDIAWTNNPIKYTNLTQSDSQSPYCLRIVFLE